MLRLLFARVQQVLCRTEGSMEPVTSIRTKSKVLVVDDERSIADTLSIILSHHGFDTAIAYGGAHAVETASEWNPDILLTDVVMPGMNGVEAAICIRALQPTCKIVLFSGQTVSHELLVNAHFDMADFKVLQKPIHPDELIAALRELIASRPSNSPPGKAA